MRLLLIRHGQTACNVTNRWQGWADCALNDVGMAQAQAVSRWLTGERIDALYSSDLRRALQTAWAIGEPHGLQPIADAGLRGRKAGQFEGLFEDQVLALAAGPHRRSLGLGAARRRNPSAGSGAESHGD